MISKLFDFEEIKNKKKYWEAKFPNGDSYQGEKDSGLPNGYGVYI